MPDDPKDEQRKRAEELRKQIEELNKPPKEDHPAKQPDESPNEYIQRRSRELARKKQDKM